MSQTRSKSVAENNGIERILEEISGKISILCSKYDNFTTMFETLEQQTREYREKVELLLLDRMEIESTASRKNNVDEIPNTNVQELFQEWNECNIEKEAFKKRSQMKALWFKLLNERKQAYWNAIKSENLADTYESWKSKENVIFPRKFRVKEITAEPSEETKIRINLALQRFETEIILLRLRVPKYKNKYEKTDAMMYDELNKRSNGNIRKKLIELWNNDVTREEEKSKKILESKTAWLEQYESNYGNEPIKISKNARKQNQRNKQQNNGYKNPRTENRYTSRPNERNTDSRHMSYAEALKKGIPHHVRRSDDSNSMSDQYSRHNQNGVKHSSQQNTDGWRFVSRERRPQHQNKPRRNYRKGPYHNSRNSSSGQNWTQRAHSGNSSQISRQNPENSFLGQRRSQTKRKKQ